MILQCFYILRAALLFVPFPAFFNIHYIFPASALLCEGEGARFSPTAALFLSFLLFHARLFHHDLVLLGDR